jgi:hypothetical protein
MVAGGRMATQEAVLSRQILRNVGVDINEAANGVFLPRLRGTLARGAYHPRLHTTAYYREVYQRLSGVTARSEALEVLEGIRAELLRGTFPY